MSKSIPIESLEMKKDSSQDSSTSNTTYSNEIPRPSIIDEEEKINHQPPLSSSSQTATTTTPIDPDDDPNINGGYAWVILACIFTISCCSWGGNSSFAVYFAYYETHNLYPTATVIDFAAIGGITFGVGIFCAPVINYISGKITPKGSLIIGNICQFLALFITSFDSHNQLWQLYLTQGVLQSFGLAFLGMPSFTILPLWFQNKGNKEDYSLKRRMLTFSQSIMAAGTGGGGLLFNLGMQKVIQVYGLRWALRTQSFITLFCVSISIFFLKDKSKKVKVEFTMFDKDVFFFPAFWGNVFFVMFTMFGYVVTLYSLADWTISLGYTEYQGSVVAGMISLGIIIGRPALGIAADRFGAILIAIFSTFLTIIFVLAMWIPSRNYASALALGVFLGAFSGVIFVCMTSINILVIDFRMNKMNVTFSMGAIVLGASAVVSPIIGLSLQKSLPSPTQYVYCSAFVGAAYFAALVDLIILRGFLISVKEIQTPGLTDKEYFSLRPKVSRILRNSLKLTNVGWL
ncbi:monocarboxylate transporter [Scheffersomyces coipomensis]|uniref:monocarboxylate transporter n=1 Tax=Scheffersomyces coipomensis TaxID=1788519 RepID=UPI00315D9AB2